MDLCSLVFEVETHAPEAAFHHVFWAMIAQVDPLLANELQFGKGYKPYTVSPLMRMMGQRRAVRHQDGFASRR